MKKVFFVIVLCVFFFQSCSTTDSDSSDFVLYPDSNLFYGMFPNDVAKNDSVAKYLAHGVVLLVSPGGSYSISFETDSLETPELQLFRIYSKNGGNYGKIVRRISPEKVGNRLVYNFLCEESKPSYWATSLAGSEKTYYNKSIKNLSFKGSGIYPESFSIRFIKAGEYTGTSDSLSFEDLAKNIFNSFKTFYQGISIDTFFIVNAKDVDSSFSDLNPLTVPYGSSNGKSQFYPELTSAKSKIESAALDLVVVHKIDALGILGYSPLFGHSMLDSGSAIVLATHVQSSTGLIQLPSSEIAYTAVHEAGHFFGLRHTTATRSELASGEDFSNVEDGLEDTPFCGSVILAKNVPILNDFFQPAFRFMAAASKTCPDEINLMYPLSSEQEQSFSFGQIELVRKNLTLIKH